MKKGFTLIELLAVIVILAVIALISVPLILGVIENSKVGAFKDSVSLTFSSAELYEAKNNIPEDGVDLKDLSLKNNNFKYGKIIKNANNELEAVNVSNGYYCAKGLLTNLNIYKGECDVTAPASPTANVENVLYGASKEYTLSAPSTMSGIDSYEYYLSDSTDIPASDVVISGSSKTNKITIDKVSKYVFFRVVSKAGLKGEWSSAKTNYVDATNPLASLTTNTITSKSITLSAVCSDTESGITKYEFSKDGTIYLDNGTNNAYTFSNLTSGTNTYYVKCTNGANLSTVSSVSASTALIDVPTYSISPTGYVVSKTLTITYPVGYTNEYSLDGGSTWLTYTTPLTVTSNITVIARVNDGLNYVTGASYTVDKILYYDDYKIWLEVAGINSTTYTTLNSVLTNTTVLTQLMSNTSAIDYIVKSGNSAGKVLMNGIINTTTAFQALANNSTSLLAVWANSDWNTAIKTSTIYSSTLVPTILNTASLTNALKYTNRLPFYIYNNGTNYSGFVPVQQCDIGSGSSNLTVNNNSNLFIQLYSATHCCGLGSAGFTASTFNVDSYSKVGESGTFTSTYSSAGCSFGLAKGTAYNSARSYIGSCYSSGTNYTPDFSAATGDYNLIFEVTTCSNENNNDGGSNNYSNYNKIWMQ